MHCRILGLVAALAATAALPLGAAAQKPPDNTVTLAAAPTAITFGKSTTLSGKVTEPDHAGAEVTLRADPFPVGGGDAVVATSSTDANGDFQFAGIMPDRNTRYSVRAKTSPPVESAAVDVLVRIRVSLRLADFTPRAGQRVRFSGSAPLSMTAVSCESSGDGRPGVGRRSRSRSCATREMSARGTRAACASAGTARTAPVLSLSTAITNPGRAVDGSSSCISALAQS
jgi:hypothetical protein